MAEIIYGDGRTERVPWTPPSETPPRAEPATLKNLPGRVKAAVGRGVESRTGGPVTGEALAGADPRTPSGSMVPLRSAAQLATSLLPGSWPEVAATLAPMPFKGSLLTGPLKRIGAAGVAGGATAALEGDAHPIKRGLELGASQLAGEIPAGIARASLMARSGGRALDQAAAKTAHDRAMHGALEETDKTAHATDVTAAETKHGQRVREWEETGAANIMAALKSKVSALSGFPATERGLLDAIYGEGKVKVSEKFDQVVKDMVASARGRSVDIRATDADALGLRRLKTTGQKDQRGIDIATVDASALAEKLVGAWRRDPGVYRRGTDALDRLGIGDPAARAEYKAYRAFTDFADKSGMLRGKQGNKFYPEKAEAAFTKLKTVDELRRRGEGDIFRGPIAKETQGRPTFTAPTAPGPRQLPAETKAEGVTARQIPKIGFAEGALLAEVPFLLGAYLTGHSPHFSWGMPALAGGTAGHVLSGRRVITNAPIHPAAEGALRGGASVGARAFAESLGLGGERE